MVFLTVCPPLHTPKKSRTSNPINRARADTITHADPLILKENHQTQLQQQMRGCLLPSGPSIGIGTYQEPSYNKAFNPCTITAIQVFPYIYRKNSAAILNNALSPYGLEGIVIQPYIKNIKLSNIIISGYQTPTMKYLKLAHHAITKLVPVEDRVLYEVTKLVHQYLMYNCPLQTYAIF